MMPMTASALIASWLGIADCPPPEVKRGRRHGMAPHCWLCGGDTHDEGWPRDTLLPPTFTQHNIARRIDSDSVCQPCAAILRGEVFQDLVKARGLRDGFGARSSTRVPRATHSIRETMLAELRESDPAAFASLCQLYPEIAGRGTEAAQ